MKSLKRTAFMYHEYFLMHNTGKGHPEHYKRLSTLYRYIFNSPLVKEQKITIFKAAPEEKYDYILLTHSEKYLQLFNHYSTKKLKYFEHTDNAISRCSFKVALFHGYASLQAADMIMNDQFDKIFIAARPPSHHAGRDYALGFCFINSVAVAANYLISKWNLKKILIIDIDAHHGNGTQDIFYDRKDVFFFSIHEHPSFLFPGTGRFFEIGINAGVNYTLNCPVLPNISNKQYISLFQENLKKIFSFFKPDIILVSAGYDTHELDEMTNISLSTETISTVVRIINEYASKYCNNKIIYFLEGGYHIESLCKCVYNTLEISSTITD